MIRACTVSLAVALSLLSPPPALAQELLSAEEFDAYTQGKTLFYGRNGQAYGAEIYHKNRRVQWSFLDGQCKEGRWYEEAGQICFVYEDNANPQCWTFQRGENGLIATFENEPTTAALYEARDVGDDLLCPGPKVGV